MTTESDFLVIGSGLPGSLMALALAKGGHRVSVIDRTRHPRFAIGESSTPTADSYLRRLADDFHLPEVEPLSLYSRTRSVYPDLMVGRKRGFSYFRHFQGQEFEPGTDHANEMVVAANSSDELADSHWRRSDVDSFLVSQLSSAGIAFSDETSVHEIQVQGSRWQVRVSRLGEEKTFDAGFLVDATGNAGVVTRRMGVPEVTEKLDTSTGALFAHFDGLKRFSDLHPATGDHPFLCDDAAVHQVLDDSWMWQLRFHTGLTSCGFCMPVSKDRRPVPLGSKENSFQASRELLGSFMNRLKVYPTLARQFKGARATAPEDKAYYKPRLQHLFDFSAFAFDHSPGWCALPGTIGFVDPLHSKGLAHAISGVYRLASVFNSSLATRDQNAAISDLMAQFYSEIRFLDELIAPCYSSLRNFAAFRLATFWYFAAATRFEKRMQTEDLSALPFLSCDDIPFREALHSYRRRLKETDLEAAGSVVDLESRVRELLQPFDEVGLFSPLIPNMYSRTAAPKEG